MTLSCRDKNYPCRDKDNPATSQPSRDKGNSGRSTALPCRNGGTMQTQLIHAEKNTNHPCKDTTLQVICAERSTIQITAKTNYIINSQEQWTTAHLCRSKGPCMSNPHRRIKGAKINIKAKTSHQLPNSNQAFMQPPATPKLNHIGTWKPTMSHAEKKETPPIEHPKTNKNPTSQKQEIEAHQCRDEKTMQNHACLSYTKKQGGSI